MTNKPRKTVLKDGPDPIDVYVGGRVRARRLGLRMSQSKLADALGLTFQQVQKYENGTNRIGASNLYRTAKALGVAVGYFYEGHDPDADFDLQPPDRQALTLMADFTRIDSQKLRKNLAKLVADAAKESDVANDCL